VIAINLPAPLCRLALLLTASALLSPSVSSAQTPKPTEEVVYTHTLPELPGKSVQFSVADSAVFYHAGGKTKLLRAPLTKQAPLAATLAFIKANPKAKLGPLDALLYQDALATWDSVKMTIGFTITASGLGYKITEQGTGPNPQAGKRVTVHYRGYLENGQEFDSSFKRAEPFEFMLGTGQVIKGWDEGIQLFPIGSKGTLRIPADLGYGARGAGAVIPPNSVLYFDIEVVKAD
jgi:FKBP-type peptidyl-prolyl cis-trans isomerase